MASFKSAKIRSLSFGLILAASLLASKAHADGNKMFEFCNLVDMDIVVSYVAGALEMSDLDVDTLSIKLQDALERRDEAGNGLKQAWSALQGYCAPEGDIAYEAAGIFCSYLRTNPTQRKRKSVELLNLALHKAWSCH